MPAKAGIQRRGANIAIVKGRAQGRQVDPPLRGGDNEARTGSLPPSLAHARQRRLVGEGRGEKRAV